MGQVYETYKENEFVSTLLTQISWSNHLAILSSSKSEVVANEMETKIPDVDFLEIIRRKIVEMYMFS